MDSCIKEQDAEKYRLSAKEVATQFAEYCKKFGMRENCDEMADIIFRANDHQHPSGFRRVAKIMNHRIKATGSGAQRTAGRASSWAKSLFNRLSAFQSPVREKEGAAVMHPIRPVFVPDPKALCEEWERQRKVGNGQNIRANEKKWWNADESAFEGLIKFDFQRVS
ncbi:MAG: hypothetical protein M1826_006321 [Phylliscum demangeonii]|nr:MAG: hypothetical protein M1826_006321 [Phylliscum demangeonii]